MKKYLLFGKDGAVVQSVTCSKHDAAVLAFLLFLYYVEDTAEVGDKYVALEGGAARAYSIGAPPTKCHVFDEASRGWVFSGAAFDAAREDRRAEIDAARDLARYSGVTYNGVCFDSDQVAAGNLTGWAAAVAAGIPVPEGFTWRSADNRDIPFTAEDILGLAAAMATKTTACYQRAWSLKAELDELTDYQQVKDFDITTGWPE